MKEREARRMVRHFLASWLIGTGSEPPDLGMPKEVEAIWPDEVKRVANRLLSPSIEKEDR